VCGVVQVWKGCQVNPGTDKLMPAKRSKPGGIITLAHGGGGQLTDELIEQTLLPHFHNETLGDLLDSAEIDVPAGRLALTIDGYVVTPWKFPGGDIGKLAVSGTVNDLAVVGARPVALALSLIIAEGFAKADLDAVAASIAETAKIAGVKVVTGDTKVVGREHGDGVYCVTAGLGVRGERKLHPGLVKDGDVVIVSGTLADHGMSVMLAREMPHVVSAVVSDAAPLNGMIEGLLAACAGVRFLRDPTRGGVSGLCADLARRTNLHVSLDEDAIPVRRETAHIADMLGIDVMDVANEGKVVVVVAAEEAEAALACLRGHPLGRDAVVIGRIEGNDPGLCSLRTKLGGRRVIQKPYGEQLPRIC
jgi:hydrogenase expression/formation protein HypE